MSAVKPVLDSGHITSLPYRTEEGKTHLHVYIPSFAPNYEMKITLRGITGRDFRLPEGSVEELKELMGAVRQAVEDRFSQTALEDWGAVYDPESGTSVLFFEKDMAKHFEALDGNYSKERSCVLGDKVVLRKEDQKALSETFRKTVASVGEALETAYQAIAPEGMRAAGRQLEIVSSRASSLKRGEGNPSFHTLFKALDQIPYKNGVYLSHLMRQPWIDKICYLEKRQERDKRVKKAAKEGLKLLAAFAKKPTEKMFPKAEEMRNWLASLVNHAHQETSLEKEIILTYLLASLEIEPESSVEETNKTFYLLKDCLLDFCNKNS